jgi:hypothetical protein
METEMATETETEEETDKRGERHTRSGNVAMRLVDGRCVATIHVEDMRKKEKDGAEG